VPGTQSLTSISLLLKLHSTLSGVPDSFDLNDCEPPPPVPVPNSPPHPASNSRIGDGPFFIAKLLYKIAKLDPMCREFISLTKERLWPKTKSDDELEAKEAREREERRRRAKERQQKLMAEFKTKQRQFMEKAKETGALFKSLIEL
jgi:E3 ubiquitin-protein ligase UBR3